VFPSSVCDTYNQTQHTVLRRLIRFFVTGLYLTTLTFIQDGAPNNVGTLVNFRKRQKAAEVIEEIQKWQSKPFNYAKVDLIHDYIMNCLSKFDNRPDVSDEFWNLSLEREPREREDERMARLLQETGFL
jgi:son of sevenless-like protein